jgi:hypothetical protein
MSNRTGTTASADLDRVQGDLRWLLQASEEAIGVLVAAFGELTRDTDTILRLASAIVDCVEDESVSSVLASVHSLGLAAKQFVGDRLQATSGILDTVTMETALLSQLSQVTDSQAKVALDIKILNVHTKIEVAHLGSVGVGFEYLARELADFSTSLAHSTDELTRHTSQHQAANEKTQSMLSVELPHLREELSRVEVNLSDDLEVLDSGLKRLARTPVQFRDSAEKIASQIAGVVVAAQGHDITRQQLEHVQEALAIVSHKLSGQEAAGTTPEIACAHAGLAIQVLQLRDIKATIAEWTSQIRECMESIFRISASELIEVGPLVLEQEQSMSSQLSHIELLERECQTYSERIRSTLEGISNLSQLVAEHIHKSESARNRLRLLTFNSVIEASRLGSQADAICVIADGIAEVSVEWTNISQRSGSALQEILNLSKRISQVMETFSQNNSVSLKGAQAQTKTALENLRSAASFAAAQGDKIKVVTDAMQAVSGKIGKTRDLLDGCFARIDAVSTALENIRLGVERDHPDVKQEYNPEEVEKVYSASYTTQTEREVLLEAIYGIARSTEKACAAGNSVELF